MSHKNRKYRFISVYPIPKNSDYLFIHGEQAVCKRYQKALEKYEESPEMKAFIDENHEILQYFENKTGTPIRTLTDVKDLHATLYVEYLKNFTCVNA